MHRMRFKKLKAKLMIAVHDLKKRLFKKVDRRKLLGEMETALDIVLRADRQLKDAVPYNGPPNLALATSSCQDIIDNIDAVHAGLRLQHSYKNHALLNCTRIVKELVPLLMDAVSDPKSYEAGLGSELKKHKKYRIIKYRHEINNAVYHFRQKDSARSGA